MRCLVVLLILFSCLPGRSQVSKPDVGINMQLGNNLTWWRYNRGVGLGWDRTDNIRVPIVATGVYLETDKWRIYAGVSREWWSERRLELFEDNTRRQSRLTISDRNFPITDLEFKLTHFLVSTSKYKFGLGMGLGTFFLDTDLELQDNFGTKWMWSADVINQFQFKERWAWLLGINYEKKIILPEIEQAISERHELFSYGLWLGINYRLTR